MWFLLQIHVHVNQDDYTFFKHSFTCSGTFKKRPFTEQCNSFMKILPAHFIPQCTAYHVSIKHRVNEITWIILRFRKIVEVNLKCSIVKLFWFVILRAMQGFYLFVNKTKPKHQTPKLLMRSKSLKYNIHYITVKPGRF